MAQKTVPHNKRLTRAAHVVATTMDDEVVMMDVNQGTYFVMTGSGPSIWDKLAEPILLDDLLSALTEEFSTEAEPSFENYVEEFLSRLIDQGLVETID